MRRSTFRITTLAAAVAVCLCVHSAAAQEPIGTGGVQPIRREPDDQTQGAGDPFLRFLFPPELIMQHQGDIGLTDAQRTTITTAIQQAQGKFVEAQFKLSGEGEKLARLLQGVSIDEAQAVEQVDRILSLEREVKRAQVGLLVRLKNALTPAQQARLAQLRRSRE